MTLALPNSLPPVRTMYRALVERDRTFEGVFIAAVRTTGIFCRPTCPARKPDEANVEFFPSAHEAILSGYRPCRRCRPLEPRGETPEWIRSLLDRIARAPAERVRDADLRVLGLEPARVRRWFKQELGITFQGYQRAIRLGEAMGRLKLGDGLSQVAFEHGYESLSGFRDAFQRLFGKPPGNGHASIIVTVNRILTPLGPMLAGVTDRGLCLLEFIDRRMIETQMERIRKRLNCSFVPGDHPLLHDVSSELNEYFEGKRKRFTVPLDLGGTPFQERAWEALLKIPYGSTRSYAKQAMMIDSPSATRAVARANGDNRIAIIIPCHRVIGADGKLTGYGGGLWRKQFLLDLEQQALRKTTSKKRPKLNRRAETLHHPV